MDEYLTQRWCFSIHLMSPDKEVIGMHFKLSRWNIKFRQNITLISQELYNAGSLRSQRRHNDRVRLSYSGGASQRFAVEMRRAFGGSWGTS